MKKHYYLFISLLFFAATSFAQPADKTIIVVGSQATTPTDEDQVLIDSLSMWVENVVYYGAAAFNAATADTMYAIVDGVVISESIDSKTIPNFALRDEYPVPCIVMEGVMTGDPVNETTKWPLLIEGVGGIYGYGTPEEVDVQWLIVNNENYITKEYDLDDVIYYAPEASRGVPYIHHIDPDHVILATAFRSDGGDVEDFEQDEAIACAYIMDPAIIYMNVAYTYLPVGTEEFYGILKRSAEFLFDFMPVSAENMLSENTKLSVYPNPSQGPTHIRFNAYGGKNVSVKLISIMGGEAGTLFHGKTTEGENIISFNSSEYTTGIYFVELNIEGKVAYQKFVLK